MSVHLEEIVSVLKCTALSLSSWSSWGMNPWTQDFSLWVCVGNQDVSNYLIGCQEILSSSWFRSTSIKNKKHIIYQHEFCFFLLKKRLESLNQISNFRACGDYCFKGSGRTDKNWPRLPVSMYPGILMLSVTGDLWSLYFPLKAVCLTSVLSSPAQLSEHFFFSVLPLELTLSSWRTFDGTASYSQLKVSKSHD